MSKRIYLEEIVEHKRARILERRDELLKIKEIVEMVIQAVHYEASEVLSVQSATSDNNSPSKKMTFYQAMAREGLSIIGEVKKASPSKGMIKEDFHPIEIAKIYEGAVDAISVLTEENYFLGKDEYLKAISEEVVLPTLCKDFIVDPLQVYNAKYLGASAILLIVAILTDDEIKELYGLAESLSLDVLVEVHTGEELQRALSLGVKIIGINNRNLKTFETDLGVTIELRKMITSPDTLVISESGILNEEDIRFLREARIDGILVGESFMKAPDIVKHAEAFRNASRS